MHSTSTLLPKAGLRMGPVNPNDFQKLTDVWEASVRATHHFLTEDDLLLFKRLIREQYLFQVDLTCIREEKGQILGFLGVADDKIEMLFVHPAFFRQGIGKALANYAVDTLKLSKVDVNEQNQQALDFYLRLGFLVKSRSSLDGMGKPYPLLHLEMPSKQLN
ncbi:GNAT family N-acetyltransferase [Tellurirhabdus bombi]|uniref:GNAT family N-acetyltransferase n=1 Tax=Tellurirhabdus bombi TaxID=2907205 RepID=UPI001F22774A|nr:GNAT family N-acetyltransferase [Tellurirhabdus bombi]